MEVTEGHAVTPHESQSQESSSQDGDVICVSDDPLDDVQTVDAGDGTAQADVELVDDPQAHTFHEGSCKCILSTTVAAVVACASLLSPIVS